MCSAVCICVREALKNIFVRNEFQIKFKISLSMYFCAFSVCPYLHSVSGKQTGSKTLRGTCALRLSLSCQTSQTDFRDDQGGLHDAEIPELGFRDSEYWANFRFVAVTFAQKFPPRK